MCTGRENRKSTDESNNEFVIELLSRIFIFFDSLIEDNIILREIPEFESDEIKNRLYKNLYLLINTFYNKYKKYDIDLKKNILSYISNLDSKELTVFRYNLSDIIKFSEEIIECDVEYCENAEFRQLYFNVISAFRSLMIFIDTQRTKKINEELIKAENLSNNIKESYNELEHNVSQLYKVIENIEKTANSILPQAITVLGIFVAIIVVYLGAEELIGTLNRLFNETPNYFFISLITISHVLFNLIFFLMFLLARISKSSINIRCTKFEDIKIKGKGNTQTNDKNEIKDSADIDIINESLKELLVDRRICANCKYANTKNSLENGYFEGVEENTDEYNRILTLQCGQLDKFIKKYAYIFYINIIFVCVELGFLFWWLLRDKIFNDYIFEIASPKICLVAIILIAILITVIVCKIFYGFGKIQDASQKKREKYLYIISTTIIVFLFIIIFLYGFDLQYSPSRAEMGILTSLILIRV